MHLILQATYLSSWFWKLFLQVSWHSISVFYEVIFVIFTKRNRNLRIKIVWKRFFYVELSEFLLQKSWVLRHFCVDFLQTGKVDFGLFLIFFITLHFFIEHRFLFFLFVFKFLIINHSFYEMTNLIEIEKGVVRVSYK